MYRVTIMYRCQSNEEEKTITISFECLKENIQLEIGKRIEIARNSKTSLFIERSEQVWVKSLNPPSENGENY